MRTKILAAILLVLTVLAVSLNTYAVGKEIEQTARAVEAIQIEEDTRAAEAQTRAAYDSFKEREDYLSITLNHSDLRSIEEMFSEMIGMLSVADADGARVTKSRLTDALSHLRRLCGLNMDSVL